MFISVAEEHMKNKQYSPSVAALAQDLGYIENDIRIIDRSEFLAYLRKELGLSKYKCQTVLDAFIAADLIQVDKTDSRRLLISPLKSHFIKLLKTTVRFCVKSLSDLSFKVYCYLFGKYNIHLYYNHVENYFFSENELLRQIGYNDRAEKNHRMIKEVLSVLKKLKLIDYNEKNVSRPGKHGTYHELYGVYEYSDVQVDVIKQIIDENRQITDDEIVQDALYFESKEEIKGLSEKLLTDADGHIYKILVGDIC